MCTLGDAGTQDCRPVSVRVQHNKATMSVKCSNLRVFRGIGKNDAYRTGDFTEKHSRFS